MTLVHDRQSAHPAIRRLPPPLINNGSLCHDKLIERLKACGRVALVESLQLRRDAGVEKYAVLVQANNGRSANIDAFQNALDLAVSLEQKLQETIHRDRKKLYKIHQKHAVSTAEYLLWEIEQEELV